MKIKNNKKENCQILVTTKKIMITNNKKTM